MYSSMELAVDLVAIMLTCLPAACRIGTAPIAGAPCQYFPQQAVP
jgi:hypothetical protein